MNITRAEIQDLIKKKCAHLPSHIQEMIETAVIEHVVQEKPVKDVFGFTPAALEELYSLAYSRFSAGRYREALQLFEFLYRFDTQDERLAFGIAASYHQLKRYEDAAGYYILCHHLNPFNPVPSFHLYDCFMRLHQPLAALNAIQETIALSKISPQYKELEAKAQLESQHLESLLPGYLDDFFASAKAKRSHK